MILLVMLVVNGMDLLMILVLKLVYLAIFAPFAMEMVLLAELALIATEFLGVIKR